MFFFTGLSAFRSERLYVKWTIPILISGTIAAACFAPLWYPNYYPNQAEVWTTDLILIWTVYNYILYLQSRWDISNCFDSAELPQWMNAITLTFYWLFLVYWAYYGVIQFMIHNEPSAVIQCMNAFMSVAWYFFFSTAATLYYFVCAKLLQRSLAVQGWLDSLAGRRPMLEDFYQEYNDHCKHIRRFSGHWNFVVFLGFILLGFHIPIDLVSVLIDGNLFDIPGAVIKGLALSWYLYTICRLNDLETKVVSYLYKNRMYALEDLQVIERYISYRGIGLDFYGIHINTGFIMKVVLLVLNLAVPTAYALLKKQVGIGTGSMR